MKFLKWKYGLETPPPETKPKTLEDVKREDELIAKAKAGKVAEKVEVKAPIKGPTARAFNVYVGEEYYQVEVEPAGGPAISALPSTYAPSQPPSALPKTKAPSAPLVEGEEAPVSSKVTVAPGDTTVLAPIPGTVVRYLVKEGANVKAGMGVVVLEAMKMENEISAPAAGKIKSITCKPGDKVSGGTVLAIIG
jgi:biotin carboxyl carrier protein